MSITIQNDYFLVDNNTAKFGRFYEKAVQVLLEIYTGLLPKSNPNPNKQKKRYTN
jgi:hypothetical protein